MKAIIITQTEVTNKTMTLIFKRRLLEVEKHTLGTVNIAGSGSYCLKDTNVYSSMVSPRANEKRCSSSRLLLFTSRTTDCEEF